MRHGTVTLLGTAALLLSGCATADRQGVAADGDGGTAMRDVTAGCAMCIFHMEGVDECVLGVEIDGEHYLVDGKAMDDLGDAHADDGL